MTARAFQLNEISTKPLSISKFSLTVFSGFTGTLPVDEITDLTWPMLVANTANSEGPATVIEKDRAPYFICCQLKVAPYIKETRARAIREKWPSLEGKQRSSSHVTCSNTLIFEFDGLDASTWDKALNSIQSSGLTALIYSTHSFGRPDKPGVHVRVLIPMDKKLEPLDYTRAWRGVETLLFKGIASPDQSGRHIYQQQGIWATHPDRKHLAFRYDIRGGLISTESALAAAPVQVVREKLAQQITVNPTAETARLESALPWLDADDTSTWMANITAFKAVSLNIGIDAARSLAVRYSAQGSETATAKNDNSCYDPTQFFNNVCPNMPADIGMAVLCANARDMAVMEVKTSKDAGDWTARGQEAAIYLAKHHPRLFNELKAIP